MSWLPAMAFSDSFCPGGNFASNISYTVKSSPGVLLLHFLSKGELGRGQTCRICSCGGCVLLHRYAHHYSDWHHGQT